MMIRCVAAWLLFALSVTASFSSNADEPAPPKPLTVKQIEQIEAWRKEFPYQSPAERLQYEAPFRNAVPPKLSSESERHLTEDEVIQFEPGDTFTETQRERSYMLHYAVTRSRSLETLHTEKVAEFVQREGFGAARVPPPGPSYFPSPEVKPLELVKLPPLSAEETSVAAAPLLRAAAAGSDLQAAAPPMMPSLDTVEKFHSTSIFHFANPLWMGHVKDRDHVAGFSAHAFYHAPTPLDQLARPKKEGGGSIPIHEDDLVWKLTRLELVSLLKHARPMVYESEHLPRMEELTAARTRDIDQFESAAIVQLRDGEEIQTSATPNRIVMLGAIRANKQCMQCHDVPRGTLLGAFSYELRRDPPIKLTVTPPLVQ